MKTGEQKVYRTLKKKDGRGLLQDNRVPGTSAGTRVTVAPGPVLAGPAPGVLGESWVNGSLPCQTGLEKYQDLVA